ncbi:pentapeptide repeat-containing protein [Nocardia sp. CA-129566]|uniref:pentapeptide repeat-containing protein n=1 Tax=Nocardia sp. CA-129566 TaxID=3239976 RepID=UPI003D98F41F
MSAIGAQAHTKTTALRARMGKANRAAIGRRAVRIGLLPAVLSALGAGLVVALVAYGFLRLITPTSDTKAAPIDITRVSLTVVAGVGGVVALVIAYRRQRDLEQSRFVERFGAAAAQLGATDVAVRIAGAYAMAGVADESDGLRRQQCIDVLCGYLRLPYDPDHGSSGRTKLVTIIPRVDRGRDRGEFQEHIEYRHNDREVRRTIIRVIADHLTRDVEYNWRASNFDFRTAHLENADFTDATFTDVGFEGAIFSGTTRFVGARFTGSTSFADTTFTGPAWFVGATFTGPAWFAGATFTDSAQFRGVTFSGTAGFDHTAFTDTAGFEQTTFTGTAGFRDVRFGGTARFEHTTFTGTARFERTTFTGAARFEHTTFAGTAGFEHTTFTATAGFEHTTFTGTAGFREVTFTGTAGFRGAAFTGTARFVGATFSGIAEFRDATFSGPAEFRDATFTSSAKFEDAKFSGPTWFGSVRFSGPTWFEHAAFTSDTNFSLTDFGTSDVSFRSPRQWGPPAPKFDWDDNVAAKPPNVEPQNWPPARRPTEPVPQE